MRRLVEVRAETCLRAMTVMVSRLGIDTKRWPEDQQAVAAFGGGFVPLRRALS
jgi:hypothetical protein